MTTPETFTTALQNLATHKLRTALTMLGMIFGVGAVIAMLSIGAGGEKKALESIGRLGLRNVIVRAKTVKREEPAGAASSKDVPVASNAQEIWIPVSTAMRKFDRDPLDAPVDELLVQLKEGVSTRDAATLIRPLLERLHGGADDYEIVVPEALLEQSRQTQRIFSIVMGSIAGISLLVGGIGIMNIMLASVLERTREIGIRRAIGARKQDIKAQFVIESFTISVIGGLSGIIIGIGLAKMVAAYAGWPTVITFGSLLLSCGVSITVGLVSGIYPAARASELNPIEALRYE